MTLAEGAATEAPRRLRALHVAAVAAGNGLEFFDFIIYSTFAIFIGRAFFPSKDPTVSLLLSLAAFGVGFITRPLGGLVLGRFGDKVGRKPALLISFALMGAGALGLAVTPTYADIGLAAPILVIVARLIQGFALGGEVGPATAFLVEAAGEGRRGLIGAWQSASQGAALLGASLTAVALSCALPPSALEGWGWRVAFLVGLTIIPFGLLIRRNLPETAGPRSQPVHPRQPVPWRIVALSVAMLASGTINTYVNNYMTTFAMDSLRMPPRAAFGVGLVAGVCTLVCLPIGGALSDRFGRKPVMVPLFGLSTALVLPAFLILLAHPTPFTLYWTTALVSIPGGLGAAAVLVSITESFPACMRSLAVGAIYAFAIAIFGGSAQLVVAALIHATHQPLAAAWYRLAASAIGIAAMIAMPESAPARRVGRVLAPAPA
jgi:MHS family citrate/tricarballylate:H+ symporter-like MFS transporter